MAAHLEVGLGGMLQGSSAMAAWPASINKKRTSSAFWEEEVVQLMMGRPFHHLDVVARPSSNTSSSSPSLPGCATLDLLGASSSSARSPPPFALEDPESSSSPSCFDLDADAPLPCGWEKCLDLQTGSIYYLNRSTGLSTSCDPRKMSTSSVNWPASPSSSSDLTVEANMPVAAPTYPIATSFLELPSKESTALDLTLSLKPSSPCLRPPSLNHSLNRDLKGDLNHKLKSLISSQSKQISLQAPLNKPSFSSSVSSLPFNSTRPSYTLPSCASSVASSTSCSSPSTLFSQEPSALKDMGSLATSKMSSRGRKSVSMNQSLNGNSRHISNNVTMSARGRPFSREALSPSPLISKHFSGSANAKPIMNNTNPDASSPMMTVGCANCLMFVMLPTSRSPKCPRCGAFIDSDLPQPPSFKKPLSLMSSLGGF